MGKLSPEEKKTMGQAANSVKAEIEALLEDKLSAAKAAMQSAKLKAEKIDVTEPGKKFELGAKHPITLTIQEITNVFKAMGYSIVEGPEVETVWFNFDALNSPKNHPSRDMTDTFYFSQDKLLRTHTSPVEDENDARAGSPYKGSGAWTLFPFRYSRRYAFADVPSGRGSRS